MAKDANSSPVKLSLTNIIAIIVLIGAIGLGGHLIGKANQKASAQPQIAAVQTVAYDGEEGKTALELLKAKAQVEVQESSLGAFVTSINGTQNSGDHFWLFYVNGSLGTVGADQYTTKNGDKIEWRYEQFQ